MLPHQKRTADELNLLAVNNFKEYLRIPSVHPDVNYDDCVIFIQNQAESLDLPFQIYHCFPKKPVVVLSWIGQEPDLPTILLNGHMDVVSVNEEKWKYPPFGAEMDDKKNIYARGAQDMKSVSIQYLDAIRKLKNDEVVLKRTVHVCFVPDEETGGKEGMGAFVKTDDFTKLNVGFALDEGSSCSNEYFCFSHGERSAWKLHFHCPGKSGHGSLLHDNTPGEKVAYLLNQVYRFREQEKYKLTKDRSLTIGNITTMNVTKLWGGIQSNVVPDELSILVDCRLPITINFNKWEKTLKLWCKEAGEDVWIEYEQKEPKYPSTKLDDSNPYWIAFQKVADKLNLKLKSRIASGISDSRYLRELGIPAIGFSPINNTSGLAHDHNEYLNEDIFLKGIHIYTEVISAVTSV